MPSFPLLRRSTSETMISPCVEERNKHSYHEGVASMPLLGAEEDAEPDRKRVKGGFLTR